MSKKEIFKRDVDECYNKIEEILREYNCKIEFDNELEKVIVVDIDTLEFCQA